MIEIPVTTPAASYSVHVDRGLLDRAGGEIAARVRGRTAFIVTDSNVAALYLQRVEQSLRTAGFTVHSHAIPPGETSKCERELFGLFERFIDAGITRSDVVVALGGGVPGDLGGLAAAIWMRGVPVVQIPTTLLAQVDSSIGGKTGIDLARGKNLVGAFHQPIIVLTDPDALETLPPRVLADGMAEVVKHGAILDPELYAWCVDRGLGVTDPGHDMAWAVGRNVAIKAGVVSRDTHESGERMLLNFGHTIGHAVERITGFSVYTHGEAVAMGMAAACRLGVLMGITPAGIASGLPQVLQSIGLPVHDRELSAGAVANAILSDKKNRSGTLHFILLEDIGRARILPIAADEAVRLVEEAWQDG